MVSLTVYVLGVAVALLAFSVGYAVARFRSYRDVEERVEKRKDEALKQSRAVIGGQVAEQLSPLLPGFPGSVSEARFLGKPIDYIVFDGMDEKNIEQVTFVEVKSGESSLSGQERRLRDAVRDGKVRWVEHRVSSEDA